MKIFHLLPARYARKDIKNKVIKVSRFSDLNDPFELMSLEMSNKANRKLFKLFKNQVNKKYGVLCFSKTWKNPVLWSHYADKHKGVCLGFEVPDTDSLVKNITYSGTRLLDDIQRTVINKDIDDKNVERFLTTKFEDWAYEKEVRMIIPFDTVEKQGDLYFKKFDSGIRLKQVIFGARCNERNIANISRLVKNYSYDIELICARLAFTSFKVVKYDDKTKALPKS